MIQHSFDEWKKAGFFIKKGSVATWVDGKPVFDVTQTIDKFFREEFDEEVEYDYRYEINN